jgi:hypothetical protein
LATIAACAHAARRGGGAFDSRLAQRAGDRRTTDVRSCAQLAVEALKTPGMLLPTCHPAARTELAPIRRLRVICGRVCVAAAPPAPATSAAVTPRSSGTRRRPRRVCLIGNSASDGGGYGHGLEKLFIGRPDGEVTAVADSGDPAKRRAVAEQLAAAGSAGRVREYDDYREMLANEAPEVVVIATSVTPGHS